MPNNFDISLLKDVPHKPGCYIWKDDHDKILYIGKAKDLNKRMHQYFNKVHNNRINKLVEHIACFDYIVVSDENDALILENNLIKKHQPKFNVLLKEGSSSYPYILVTNTKDPKIIYTRKYTPTKGKFYGPFAAQDAKAYELYRYLNRIIPLRKCNVVPNQKCMYYDMGQCLGPCINKIDPSQYTSIKKQIDDIFNNNDKQIVEELKIKEQQASERLDFEQAQHYLNLQNYFDQIVHKQIVQLKEIVEADYIGFYSNDLQVCINIFNYVDGKLISKHENITNYYDDINECINSYIMQYYSENKIPQNIYVALNDNQIELLKNALNTNITKPIKGKKLELLTQSITNAQYFLNKHKLQYDNKFNRTVGACNELAKILNLNHASHIEIIDNANIFLENPMSGIVVFKNGIPQKQMYRKYNLDALEEKSDYHFMLYVIERRFTSLLKNGEELPDVFIVDGGTIQLNAAKKVFDKLNLNNVVKLVGLKKDEHHKTDAILFDDSEITLERKSTLYLMLANMQEEVHNFVISQFRRKDIKSKLTTFLDEVEGLGSKTKAKLLSIYPNLNDIQNVNIETLSQIMPTKVAYNLKDKIEEVFNKEQKEK